MVVIVSSVVVRGAAVEPDLRGTPISAVSLIRPGVFQAIGVISFAVSDMPKATSSAEGSTYAITIPCSSINLSMSRLSIGEC